VKSRSNRKKEREVRQERTAPARSEGKPGENEWEAEGLREIVERERRRRERQRDRGREREY
jgi:hypothetical protein